MEDSTSCRGLCGTIAASAAAVVAKGGGILQRHCARQRGIMLLK